jgi:hypothetical protein
MPQAKDARRRAAQLLGAIVLPLIASSALLRSAITQKSLDPLAPRSRARAAPELAQPPSCS